MIRHYIIIALRNMVRQKGLAIINLLGFSIGIACFSLSLLYVVNEFSYDRFHKNGSHIYRVYDWWANADRQGREPSSATPLGPAMKQDLPDVENFVRVTPKAEKFIRVGNKVSGIDVSFADPQILSVFTFPLLEGNSATALSAPNQVVLTREKAYELFGETDVVGKVVEIKMNDRFDPFIVGAVAENIPINSTIRFDLLGNFDYILNTEMGRESSGNWHMTIGISVYILLREGSKLMNEPDRLSAFRLKYFPEEKITSEKAGNRNGKGSISAGYGLQPLRDVHTDIKIDKWEATDPKNSWILITVASGVLLIACINFITLSIGRSAGRSKEVGVKKVTGSQRHQLVIQFLIESLLLSLFSSYFGLVLADILLPFFNELSERSLVFSFHQYPEMIGLLAAVILFAGLLSGIYPAIVLSGFKPIDVLKNKIRFSGSNLFTKSLITFQFVISIGLIISIITIVKQLKFMRSKDLGFDKENVVMIPARDLDTKKTYPLFRQALLSESGILGITGSAIGLGEGEGQMGRRYIFNDTKKTIIEYPVDAEFLNVLGFHLLAGRNFNAEISSDTISSVIVNEAFVQKVLGVTPEIAVGTEFKNAEGNGNKIIIGVVRNFNFENLTLSVRPQLFLQPSGFKPNFLFVRLKPGDPAKILSKLKTEWSIISPDLPFRYSFLDEKFDAFYNNEKRWANIIGWAAGVSIFLACMGLFGLISLVVINRSKEIGIRKVNGAKISEILLMLNRDFAKWVMIGFVISTPVTWYIMHKWLENFTYKTEISWWIFILAGLVSLIIAIFTVSWQSWRAARRNPVEALRYE